MEAAARARAAGMAAGEPQLFGGYAQRSAHRLCLTLSWSETDRMKCSTETETEARGAPPPMLHALSSFFRRRYTSVTSITDSYQSVTQRAGDSTKLAI